MAVSPYFNLKGVGKKKSTLFIFRNFEEKQLI
jgi:hypothetical protein